MKTLTIHITVTDVEYNFLSKLKVDRYAEYRDPEYSTLEEFLECEQSEWESKAEWFLRRNAGGTYHLIHRLETLGLVDSDTSCWHQTYILTDLGKQLVEEATDTQPS